MTLILRFQWVLKSVYFIFLKTFYSLLHFISCIQIPFISPSIHICFHCFESLVCLEASGFWYILNTKPSLGLLLNILLLSCVMEPLYFWSLSLAPSHAPVVLWWGGCSGESTYTLVLRLGGSWIVQTSSFPSSSTPRWVIQQCLC